MLRIKAGWCGFWKHLATQYRLLASDFKYITKSLFCAQIMSNFVHALVTLEHGLLQHGLRGLEQKNAKTPMRIISLGGGGVNTL